jgi:hypothetical protein
VCTQNSTGDSIQHGSSTNWDRQMQLAVAYSQPLEVSILPHCTSVQANILARTKSSRYLSPRHVLRSMSTGSHDRIRDRFLQLINSDEWWLVDNSHDRTVQEVQWWYVRGMRRPIFTWAMGWRFVREHDFFYEVRIMVKEMERFFCLRLKLYVVRGIHLCPERT